MYDCGIVGGGLAGLSLALQLGRQGLKVVLFEKEQYPFHKVCGEYIAMESWPFLQGLGVSPQALQLPRIQRLLVSAGNTRLEQSLKPGGYGVSRYTLDALLADLCRQAGVTLLENTPVKAVRFQGDRFVWETAQSHFESRLACGSYGKHANLDRQLRPQELPHRQDIPTYVGVKYHLKMRFFPQDLIALHNFEGGYAGISAVEAGRVCFCYLVTSQALKKADSIEELETQIMSQNPYLRSILEQSTSLYTSPKTISQVHFAPRSLIQDHVLLLGDASGMIPPLCGNGMSMALRASAFLGPELVKTLKGQQGLAELESHYGEFWKNQFSLRLKAGRALQSIFGRVLPAQYFFKGLRHTPVISQALIRATHGSPFEYAPDRVH